MNKGLLLIALAGSGYAGYEVFYKPSAAVQAYRQFSEALLQGRNGEAKAYLSGEVAAGQFARVEEEVGRSRAINQLVGSSYKVQSESRTEGGNKRTIHAQQVVVWNPPGVSSAMGALRVYHDQKVVMEKKDGAWKVASLEDTVTGSRDWKGNSL